MARLLMVDDDPDILNLAEQILGKAGHTVFHLARRIKRHRVTQSN